MHRHLTLSLILCMWSFWSVHGQLSPGELTEAHKTLEGLSNCTQCHDLGNKVPDQKCLACHEEISSLIQLDRGFHASSTVQSQTCIDCHSEHHGRRFDMVRFDQATFDHLQTGYVLEGAHAKVDCRTCHQPENIADPELRKRDGTFLGLDGACLSCHEDFHQGALSGKCLDCHQMTAFRPASRFNHENADFQLIGAHLDVACIECHPMTTRNGRTFQQFNDLTFNQCVDCHDTPHQSGHTNRCHQCHMEESFDRFIGQNGFQHRQTGFLLEGAHREVNCFECHAQQSAATIFTDRQGVAATQCIECHTDVHDGKFGQNCVECHNTTSFYELNDATLFDHSLTNFALEGRHIDVECTSCHIGRYTDPVPHANCYDCHDDYHEGEFSNAAGQQNCAECHTVEQPFTYTLFSLEDHAQSDFPLTGAHEATPCFACHVSEERWSFRDIGQACVDCHTDIHEAYISSTFYPQQACQTCHRTESWASIDFDHSLTEWPLTGQHAKVNCRACHFEMSTENDTFSQHFKTLKSECINCHDNIHGSQFEHDGVTDCNRCHTTIDWFPERFEHDLTRFPLTGRHAEVECKACHTTVYDDNGITRTNFKIERFDCIDCHQ